MTVDPLVGAAVADAYRREWVFVLAATVRITRDLDLAEECVQDAYAKALTAWGTDGVPRHPGAWLTTTARRRTLDLLRRHATAWRALPLLVEPGPHPAPTSSSTGRTGRQSPDPTSPTTGCGWCSPAVTPPWPGRPGWR